MYEITEQVHHEIEAVIPRTWFKTLQEKVTIN